MVLITRRSLPAPLGERRRLRRARLGEANLDVARKEVLVRIRSGRTTLHATRGDSVRGLRDNQLDLAERAATREVGLAEVLQETRARAVHGGQVAGAEVRPGRRGELAVAGVQGKDEARRGGDRDVELVIERNDSLGTENTGHFIFTREKIIPVVLINKKAKELPYCRVYNQLRSRCWRYAK